MSTLREAQELRYAAMSAGDVDALATVLDDRLVYTHSRGDRDTKASYLDKIRTGALAYGLIDHREDPPLLIGGTAIVVGEMRTDVSVRGDRPVQGAAVVALAVAVRRVSGVAPVQVRKAR